MEARDAQASVYFWKMRASHCFFVVIIFFWGTNTGTGLLGYVRNSIIVFVGTAFMYVKIPDSKPRFGWSI
jgi:hypothetical protein